MDNVDSTMSKIKKYFNIEEMKPIHSLNFNQIIYVVSLLDSLNIEDEIIDEFISISEEYLRYCDIYSFTHGLNEKIDVLNDEKLSKKRERVNVLIDRMRNSESIYTNYQKEISAQLDDIKASIGTDYSYEKEKAKKLNAAS